MTFPYWLQLLRALRKRNQRPGKVSQRKLRLRVLEDRTAPSVVTWVGGTAGDWDNPANWSTGKIPGAADSVVISTANATVTHTNSYNESIHNLSTGATDTLNWSNGSLNIASASTLSGPVNLSGGTWQGGGGVILDGLFTWTGGIMTGSGTTTANAGINFIGSGTETLDGRTLNNANSGTATWSGTTSINLYDGAVFDNELGATFNIALGGSAYMGNNSGVLGVGTGTVKNYGTLNLPGTQNPALPDEPSIDAVFLDTGPVNLNDTSNAAILTLTQGGHATGTFTLGVDGTLVFAGADSDYALWSTSKILGEGSVEVGPGSSVDVAGAYNLSGATSQTVVNGGSISLIGTVTSLGSTLAIEAGQDGYALAKIAKSVSVPTLDIYGGTLSGTGTVTVTKSLTWHGNASSINTVSAMTGTGSTTLAAGATMNLGGDDSQEFLEGRTFNNWGTINWLNGSFGLQVEYGAKFNNESGASFNVENDQPIFSLSGATPVFTNAGTFTKSGTTGTTEFSGVLFNNSGTVSIDSGTLQLDTGGTDSKGAFNLAAGTTLDINGGVTLLHSSVGIASNAQAGAMIFSNGATVDVTGSYNISSSTAITGQASVNFTSIATLTSLGGTVNIEGGGSASIAKNVSIPTLNLVEGALEGGGAVTVTGTLTWNTASWMAGSGSTTLAAGGTVNLGGAGDSGIDDGLVGRTFNNEGTVNWLNGSESFYMNSGAVFNNAKGAVFNANVPASTGGTPNLQFIGTDSTATFNNAGTFNTAAGSGNTTLISNSSFNNTGTVNVIGGTLQLYGSGTSTGKFSVSSGATLEFSGGLNNLNASTATVTGAGTVSIAGGEVDFGGSYNVANTTVSGGTVNFLTGGSVGQTFTNAGGTVNLAAGTTLLAHYYTQSAGSTFLNGGTLTTGFENIVTIGQSSSLYGPGTVNSYALVNAGAIYVGGGGAAVGTLNVVIFINATIISPYGFVQTSTGVLHMNIGGSSAGTQYDQVNVSGAVAPAPGEGVAGLAGTLDLTLVHGYNPSAGTQFDILTYFSESGDFGTKNLPAGWSASAGAMQYVVTA